MVKEFLDNPNKVKNLNHKQTKALGLALFKHFNQTKAHENVQFNHIMFILMLIKTFDIKKDILLFDHELLLNLYNSLTNNALQRQGLALAFGYSLGLQLDSSDFNIVVCVGEQALSKGESFEALSQIGALNNKVIILFYEEHPHKTSIKLMDKNISKMRTSKPYTRIKSDMRKILDRNIIGKGVLKGLGGVRNVLKDMIVSPSLFEELNIDYLGPVPINDYKMVTSSFLLAKNDRKSIAIHFMNPKSKKPMVKPTLSLDESLLNELSYEQLLDETLSHYLHEHQDTLIMASSSYKEIFTFLKPFEKRVWFFDVSSPLMFSLADALKQSNYKIVLILNSEDIEHASHAIFSQKHLHQHNITLFILNSGLVKSHDGVSFNVYDVALLSRLSTSILAQPKDKNEAVNLINQALNYQGFFALRLSNQVVATDYDFYQEEIAIGSWMITYQHPQAKAIVICYGDMVDNLTKRVSANELALMIVNARFIRPFDYDLLEQIQAMNLPIIIYEEDDKNGGFYHHLLEYFYQNKINKPIHRVGINHPFIQASSVVLARKANQIDTNALIETILEIIGYETT